MPDVKAEWKEAWRLERIRKRFANSFTETDDQNEDSVRFLTHLAVENAKKLDQCRFHIKAYFAIKHCDDLYVNSRWVYKKHGYAAWSKWRTKKRKHHD